MPSSACKKCALDRKSTRLNSSHTIISYAVFCLKKKILRCFLILQNRTARLSIRTLAPDHAADRIASSSGSVKLEMKSPPRLTHTFFFLILGRPPDLPPFPHPPSRHS